MSYHMKQQLEEIQDEAVLVAALRLMNHEPVLHPHPVRIRGYRSEMLATPCETVLAREQTGLGADIGFHREEDGRFSLVSDSFANSNMDQFINDLRRSYHEEKAVRTAWTQGLRVTSRQWVEEDNRRWLQLKVSR